MAKSDAQLLKLALKDNERLEAELASAREEIACASDREEQYEKRLSSLQQADAALVREERAKTSALQARNQQLTRMLSYASSVKTACNELSRLITAAAAADGKNTEED